MTARLSNNLRNSRPSPLAACIASLFALSAPAAAVANSWIVDSCAEGSFATPGVNHGTLRYALLNATTPASIDATGLTACAGSKISLTTGQLATNVTNVTINGPGKDVLQIDASQLPCSGTSGAVCDNRVLAHYGAGSLTIHAIGLTGGYDRRYHSDAKGGCLYSMGNVMLTSVSLSACKAFAESYNTRGGGVHALGNLTLDDSTITGSTAMSPGVTKGGGVYAAGTLALNNYSSVSQSYAKGTSAFGGGVYGKGDATLSKAAVGYNTIVSSSGNASGGGLYAHAKLTVTGGAVYHNSAYSATAKVMGGGVYVKGNAGVAQGVIKYNTATSGAYRAYGGGAYVHGNFTLTNSQAYKNEVSSSNPFSVAEGGAAKAFGNFFSSYTTVRDNEAHGYSAIGGGLMLEGGVVTISTSTISGNTSDGSYAGVDVFTGGASATTFQILSSTISGNRSSGLVGGLYVDSTTAKFYNSTIAFNTSVGLSSGPGVRLSPHLPSMAVTLESTLISNNTYGTFENDLDVTGVHPVVFNGGDTATPANNLVRVTFINPANLPGDTKQGFCPHLGKLRDNGGLTQTHALLSHSVAIDTGNTNFGGVFYDQRGSAGVNGTVDYPRISGPTGSPNPKPDIGAYEVQQNDIVFDTDFEDCVPPPV